MGITLYSHNLPSSATTGQNISVYLELQNNTSSSYYLGVSINYSGGIEAWNPYTPVSPGGIMGFSYGSIVMPSTNFTVNIRTYYSTQGYAGPYVFSELISLTITNSSAPVPSPKAHIVSVIAPTTAVQGETVYIGANVTNIGTTFGWVGVSVGGSGIVDSEYIGVGSPAALSWDYAMTSGTMSGTITVWHKDPSSGTWLPDESTTFSISQGAPSYPWGNISSITLPSSPNTITPGTTIPVSAVIQNTGAGSGYLRAKFNDIIGTSSSSKIAYGGTFNSTANIPCPTPGYGWGQTVQIQVKGCSKGPVDWMDDTVTTQNMIVGGYVVPQPKGSIISIIAPVTAEAGTVLTIGANVKNIGTVSGYIGIGFNSTSVITYTNVASGSTVALTAGWPTLMPSGNLSGVVYSFHHDGSNWILDGSMSFSIGGIVVPEYTLTINKVGNGTVTTSPSKTTYHSGDIVTLTATPATGYTFSGFSPTSPITITGNTTVTATFVAVVPPKASLISVIAPTLATSGSTVSIGANVKNIGGVGYIGVGLVQTAPAIYDTVAAGTTVVLKSDYTNFITPASGIKVYVWHYDGSWVMDGSSANFSIGNSTFVTGRKATGTITAEVSPIGLPYTAELYLNTNKIATSGAIAIASSTANGESILAPITLPTAGTYSVFVDIIVSGTMKTTFQLSNVVITSA